jgi:uncharacterized membrane protein
MRKKLSFNERAALLITQAGGSMQAFWLFVFWYGGWIAWNAFTPWRFDGEWFPLLLFISNFIQLIYLPSLQTGQNILNRHAEARAEAEYRLTRKIEKLIEQVAEMEAKQNRLLAEVLNQQKQKGGDV